MSNKSINVIVKGIVQGVGYRVTVKRIANELNIVGTVQNLKNGNVKIVAAGNSNKIEKFITLIKNNPTPFSKVDDISIESNYQNNNKYSDFKIII
ncbi:acylphosphatase [Apilactobacillus ozensis]|uniref:acylphosphatase n=1 Tax=Apilactobacillus ozensis DSM 23829 = JCM 17196 TaxID=1423781 RepID=A0A0R2AN33_9LACO|nr:acylphosphatase [Apilactobacillus ozensis]KRM68106.1 hypothetical protein FD06_GL000224 [Apilactobacillus ozensis DSM 23829 = JCM 17196]MCK8606611.1 acylphosphatase [Apilactobacillus ozensis]